MEHLGQELWDFNKLSGTQNVIHNYQSVERTWSHQWLLPDVRKQRPDLIDQADGNAFGAPYAAWSRDGKTNVEPEISNDTSVVAPIRSTLEWWSHHVSMLTTSACCFEDIPAGEVASCTNSDPHSFCFSCARKYVEMEIGKAKYKIASTTLTKGLT